jgi:hypothetical protein
MELSNKKLAETTRVTPSNPTRPSYKEEKHNSKINSKFLQNVEHRLTIKRSNPVAKSTTDDFNALQQILLDKQMANEFRNHLVKTFSSENLDFWYVSLFLLLFYLFIFHL